MFMGHSGHLQQMSCKDGPGMQEDMEMKIWESPA